MSNLKSVALLGRANSLRQEKDYKAAIALYLEFIKYFGENADLLAAIAGCYFAFAVGNPNEVGRNFEEAVSWMEKAVELAPNDARLHADLAQYYSLGLTDYEKAAQEYRRAIDLASNDVMALAGAASLYGVPEQVVTLDEAIGWLEKSIELEPRNPNHFFRLGELYREAARLQDAERVWFRALVCPWPLDPSPTQVIESTLTAR